VCFADGWGAGRSYSRNVGLYDAATAKLLYNLQGHHGGVTQAEWSADGRFLFTGGRKDSEILCWDVRNTGDVLLRFPRVRRAPSPLPPVLTGHVSSPPYELDTSRPPPVLTGHVSSLPPY